MLPHLMTWIGTILNFMCLQIQFVEIVMEKWGLILMISKLINLADIVELLAIGAVNQVVGFMEDQQIDRLIQIIRLLIR